MTKWCPPAVVRVDSRDEVVSTQAGYSAKANSIRHVHRFRVARDSGVIDNVEGLGTWVSGTTYLSEQLFYDTTGQVVEIDDSAGNKKCYNYADKFYSDNGSDPPPVFTPSIATNAYLTQVTDAIGSTAAGYYFGSGKLALTTDYNSVTTYSHYVDVLDRPTENHYAIPPGSSNYTSWDIATYSSPTQTDLYSAVGDTSASVNCVSCTHTQALSDSSGRVVTENLVNNPAGIATINTSYDGLNRIRTSSHPYMGASDPNNVNETASYDGLGRLVRITHPDGQTTITPNGAAVQGAGGLTSQQSSAYGVGFPTLSIDEAGKMHQVWVDGFGHVIEADEAGSGLPYGVTTLKVYGNEQTYTWYPCGVSSCPTIGYDSGTVSITVNGYVASAGYGQGSTYSSVATSLVSTLNLASSPVTASSSECNRGMSRRPPWCGRRCGRASCYLSPSSPTLPTSSRH